MTINFLLIDSWDLTDYIILTVSNFTKGQPSAVTFSQGIVSILSQSSTWTQNLCGDSSKPDLRPVTVVIKAPHTGSTLRLEIHGNNFKTFTGENQGFWGVRDVNILLSDQPVTESFFCGMTKPYNFLYKNNCSCTGGQYLDQTSSQCTKCHKSCKYCDGPNSSDCYSCGDHYLWDGTQCVSCDSSCATCSGPGPAQCLTCQAGFYLSENSTCLNSATALANAKKATDTVVSVGIMLMNLASQGSQFSLSIAIMAKMFQYIKYLDINYPEGLVQVLKTWNSDFFSLNISPDPPSSLDNENIYKEPPEVFEKYGVDPSFLLNYWQTFTFLLIIFGCSLIIMGAEVTIKDRNKLKCLHKYIHKARMTLMNTSLIIFYNSFGDILFYSLIEYRSSKPHFNVSKISLIISILLFLLNSGIFFSHYKVLRTLQRNKRRRVIDISQEQSSGTPNNNNSNETLELFYGDYKDDSFLKQGYLLFFIIRDLVFSFILPLLFEHALAETIMITLINLTMIIYLLAQRPFKNKLDFLQQVMGELLLLSVNISVTIMAFWDAMGKEETETRAKLGNAIIAINLSFNGFALVFLSITLTLIVRSIYQTWKKKKRNRVVISGEVQLQALTDPKGFERPPNRAENSHYKAPENTSNIHLRSDTSSLYPNENNEISLLRSEIMVTNRNNLNKSTLGNEDFGHRNLRSDTSIFFDPHSSSIKDSSSMTEAQKTFDSKMLKSQESSQPNEAEVLFTRVESHQHHLDRITKSLRRTAHQRNNNTQKNRDVSPPPDNFSMQEGASLQEGGGKIRMDDASPYLKKLYQQQQGQKSVKNSQRGGGLAERLAELVRSPMKDENRVQVKEEYDVETVRLTPKNEF